MSKSKFLRKSFTVALCAALIGGTAAALPFVSPESGIEVRAANSERDFYTEEAYGGGLIITGYKGTSADVIIPAKIFGDQVVEIQSLGENNSLIKSITVPVGVNKISYRAFGNYTNLKTVTLPNSMNEIEDYAFAGCTSLTTVTLPKTLGTKEDNYGSAMFSGCTSLKTINIPSGWEILPTRMFEGCTSLTNVTIPNTVKSFGQSWMVGEVFKNCKKLTSITIPDSVTDIRSESFYGCTALKSVRLPNALKSIRSETFYGCSSLEEITIPNSVTEIGFYSAFGNCQSLKKITIPESVTKIDDSTFREDYWNSSAFTSPNLVIYGKKNSAADKFANNQDIPFKAIIDATGVVLNTSGIALDTKETYQLKATIKPADATVNSVTWKSSNTGVAVVSSTGKVTAVNSGTASITATTANGKTAKCSVTVYGSPTSITLNKGQTSLGKGETLKLTATVGPQYAKDKSVKWRTSAPKIVTVDQKGNVKAVGNGTAWVTARTVNGKEKSCKITVKNAPSKVSMSKTALTVGVGESYKLSAVLPSGSASSVRTFRSSNNSIINMTKTNWEGQFKAIKTGTAWVTVRLYNGKESSCKITVKPAPKNVYVNKKTINMKVGQTAKVSAYLNSGAACATRTFRSSSPSIVKMTKTNWEGQFKAMKKGVAWVTVRTYNGKEASCKIVVR